VCRLWRELIWLAAQVIFAGEHETVDGRDTDGAARPCSLFDSKDPVKGTVQIAIKADRIIEHNGVQVELLGFIEQIENPEFAYLERSEFLHLSRDVAPAGRLTEGSHAWEFDFGAVEKEKETYHGTYVSLRYVVRVTIARGFVGDARHEEELVVQTLSPGVPEGADNPPIQMEVGVQDCLHISFMYQSSHYPIGAVLTGCIGFAVPPLL
jgi:vacuolar protein sorting-associated protein 26